MSDHLLRRLSARILNRPQLISPEGARAVLAAVAPRLGVNRLRLPGGEVVTLAADQPRPAALAFDDQEEGSYSSRIFQFDDETGIAHLPIEGELVHRFGWLDPTCGMTGYDGIIAKCHAMAQDAAVKGALLDIDSPGGEVYGCEAAAAAVAALAEVKPVWAVVNELTCSAACWIASQASNVFVPPTGDLGSVGVVMLHADFSGALKEAGITVTLIHAGAHKVDGHPYAPLPEAVRDDFQASCEAIRQRFAAAVAAGRGLDIEAVLKTEARVYTGAEAVAAGLADAEAPVEEVYQEFARRLA